MQHHLLNKSLLWHLALCSGLLSAARSIMVVAKHVPHALLGISVAWMGLDAYFLPVGCHPKAPRLLGITAPWVLEVGHVVLSGNRYSTGYKSTLTRAVNGLHFIYGSPVWGRMRTERHCTLTQWSHAARRCLFRMGPRYGRPACRVNRLRWLHVICVDIGAWWHPAFFATVPVDDHHGSHMCLRRICNPLMAWFLEVAHYVDGSRWLQSHVDNVSTTGLLCVAHWNVWRHLQFWSWFAAYSLPFLCRRWWGPCKLFFVGMNCFCNVQLRRDYRRSDAWFN